MQLEVGGGVQNLEVHADMRAYRLVHIHIMHSCKHRLHMHMHPVLSQLTRLVARAVLHLLILERFGCQGSRRRLEGHLRWAVHAGRVPGVCLHLRPAVLPKR